MRARAERTVNARGYISHPLYNGPSAMPGFFLKQGPPICRSR